MTTHPEMVSNSPVDNDRNAPQQTAPARTAYGVPLPVREERVDDQGCLLTKHSLRFRGDDWDIVLTNKRDDLTAAFIKEAAAATGEAEANIVNIRYFIDESRRLLVKFSVRHKPQSSSSAVQDRLATYPYTAVKALYEPRVKKPSRGQGRQHSSVMASFARARWQAPTLTCYGHAVGDVGPNGLEFRDTKEHEEVLDVDHDKVQPPQVTTVLA